MRLDTWVPMWYGPTKRSRLEARHGANDLVLIRGARYSIGRPRAAPHSAPPRAGRASGAPRARARTSCAHHDKTGMARRVNQPGAPFPTTGGGEVRYLPRRIAKPYLPPFAILMSSRYCFQRLYHLTKNTETIRPRGRFPPGEFPGAKPERPAPSLGARVGPAASAVLRPVHLGTCSALSHLGLVLP